MPIDKLFPSYIILRAAGIFKLNQPQRNLQLKGDCLLMLLLPIVVGEAQGEPKVSQRGHGCFVRALTLMTVVKSSQL